MAFWRSGVGFKCLDHLIEYGHDVDYFEVAVHILILLLLILDNLLQSLVGKVLHQFFKVVNEIMQVMLLYTQPHDDLGNMGKVIPHKITLKQLTQLVDWILIDLNGLNLFVLHLFPLLTLLYDPVNILIEVMHCDIVEHSD